MLWGWLGGIAPEKKQQGGVHTATIEWSPDGLIARIDELERRLKAAEMALSGRVAPHESSGYTACRAKAAARIGALIREAKRLQTQPHVAHETPIKTGSAMSDAVQGGSKTP